MNLRPVVFTTILILQAGVAAWSQTYTETTRVEKPVIITGEVVRLEPGKTIVIRSGGQEISYVLGPGVVVPKTVQVGRTVSLRTEAGADGTTLVKEVTTTTVTPEGQVQRTTEVTRTSPSGATTTTSTTTTGAVTGEVVRLEPGKTIVVRSGGQEISYVLGPGVDVPKTVQVGRAVSLRTEAGPNGTILVRQVTTTTVTPEGQVQRTTEVTRTKPSRATTTTSTSTTGAVTGEVVRFEPGKSIVIRSQDGEVTYMLAPKVTVPAEIQVGRTATVQFVPGPDGTSTVQRISTTTLSPDGQVRQTTDITRTDPAGRTSHSTTSTLTGKVEAYQPGKSITVTDPSGARVTYVLSGESLVPADVVMGREVTIQVAPQEQDGVTYEIERDGDTIKIKAKSRQRD